MRKYICLMLVVFTVLLTIAGCSSAAASTSQASGQNYQTSISVPSTNTPVNLTLNSNIPGMLRLVGYSGNDLINGTAQYSQPEYAPLTDINGPNIRIFQSADVKPETASDPNYLNLWKLKVNDSQPLSLWIHNMKSEGHWNLSGLPITIMEVETGTGKNSFTVDDPNPQVMDNYNLKCSAGETLVEGIMNAHCKNMNIYAGSGNLTLRFNGKGTDLEQKINIKCSDGEILIKLQQNLAARINISRVNNLVTDGNFRRDAAAPESIIFTQAYRSNQPPLIDITISGGTGRVSLETEAIPPD